MEARPSLAASVLVVRLLQSLEEQIKPHFEGVHLVVRALGEVLVTVFGKVRIVVKRDLARDITV
jgi:hypothetical protein